MAAPNPAGMISSPFRGEVVSLTANTVSVKQAGADAATAVTISFAIPANTKIVRDGKASSVQDIQKGDLVAVAFSSKPANAGLCVTQVEVCKPAAP
ncbi:MAG: hypothetical protein NTY01_00700 [Verrucomicrobia bacterium]|nr:hypothetical protein [Verrucomicrobiota bacterium]